VWSLDVHRYHKHIVFPLCLCCLFNFQINIADKKANKDLVKREEIQ